MSWCSLYCGFELNEDVNDWDLSKVDTRVLEEALWMTDNRCSIRCTAKNCNTSKSTVQRDLSEKLPKLSAELYLVVRRIIKSNTN